MEDYFSLDAILATEPRVYTVFRVAGHSLGHLDPLAPALATGKPSAEDPSAPSKPSSASHDLPAGHRVALPFWLAESLAERSVADVELPRVFGPSTRNELRVDAFAVDLHARCAQYFALGVHLARLLRSRDLPHALLSAYASRCWRAVDAGAHGSAAALRKLDANERALFFASRAVAVADARWKERRSVRIRAAHSVLGKRPPPKAPAMSPVTPRAQTRARVR